MEPNTTPESASLIKDNKKLIIGGAVVVVIALGWFMFGGKNKQVVAPTTDTQVQTENQTPTAAVPTTPAKKTSTVPAQGSIPVQEINPNPIATNPQTLTVTFTGGSFTPNSLTIKKGWTVKFVNKGQSSMWVASGPHPMHTNYPAFDQRASVGSEGSYSFTFDKVGTWKYHNHLNSSQTGTIVVEP